MSKKTNGPVAVKPKGVEAQPRGVAAPAQPEHEVVARRAYELWEAAGSPPGEDLRFWLEAERALGIRR
jgi:hypothetical protein